MTNVLITCFEPYDRWRENASWLALVELTRNTPTHPRIVTRRYPVDFARTRPLLEKDLAADFDAVILLGQAPGRTAIELESIALNVGIDSPEKGGESYPLDPDAPLALPSTLPLNAWAAELRAASIPTRVSYHAGTYLCNAALYWTLLTAQRKNLKTKAAFVHLPLATSQVANESPVPASMPSSIAAEAVRMMLDMLVRQESTALA
jgi:pyroglutamyl-peptidase